MPMRSLPFRLTSCSATINWRVALAWVHDVVAAAVALVLAFAIRLNFEDSSVLFESVWHLLPWLLPVQALGFVAVGLYRGLWRYASLRDIQQIAVAAGLATLAIPLVTYLGRLEVVVPRSVIIIFPVLLIFFMAGSRLAYRMWREHRASLYTKRQGEPVIIIGAGDTAVHLLRQLATSPRYRAVAVLDDDPRKIGRVVHGVRVVGRIENFARFAREFSVSTAIVALPDASRAQRRRIVELCANAGARALTVQPLDDASRGHESVVRRFEIDDLLGRAPVQLDLDALKRSFSGQCVMVTGAGGSIGSELCRQLLRLSPRLLVAFDVSEYGLYRLTEEFAERHPGAPLVALVGDVKDAARVEDVIAQYKPTAIFHAAAYKHVPLMESLNAWQAIYNNAYGTWVVAEAAARHGVERLVLVSTDKAVNPVNVMGASKRLAELVCQTLNGKGGLRCEIVRFGNVLGSSGSVVPKFQEQIQKGGPVTVTHPDVVRYFMSISEAAQLVIQAAAMGKGGEIFVLDMGTPVKIVDLARDMIRLAGYSEAEIPIEFTGLRPGEKLFEELLCDTERTFATPHPKVRVAKPAPLSHPAWLLEFLEWVRQERSASDAEVRAYLRRWVPEYCEPSQTHLQPLHV
ncbi:MAG: nucleoside-diphosphate sugar epimerase/dehydratase [Sutterellaceae bacterium]|nr:polysaccharide biosynthesis protein [Burkholderiaceae bacterium]MDW8429543.1 nucleoside-diphosphate sugar epimerase/dehydratase [Sutterellaceae bacterium]